MPHNHHTRVDTSWFKGVLSDKRLSQRKLASLMGIDPGALSLALNGKRKLSAQEVGDMSRLLGVDATEVLMHAGGAEDKKPQRRAQEPETAPTASKASGSWEGDFMQKWLELGLMLMNKRGT